LIINKGGKATQQNLTTRILQCGQYILRGVSMETKRRGFSKEYKEGGMLSQKNENIYAETIKPYWALAKQ
jgi:hypothetical protein